MNYHDNEAKTRQELSNKTGKVARTWSIMRKKLKKTETHKQISISSISKVEAKREESDTFLLPLGEKLQQDVTENTGIEEETE